MSDLDDFLAETAAHRGCKLCRQYGDDTEIGKTVLEFCKKRRAGETRVSLRTLIREYLQPRGVDGCCTSWNNHVRDHLGYGDILRGGK